MSGLPFAINSPNPVKNLRASIAGSIITNCRAGPLLTFVNVCAAPPGTLTTSPMTARNRLPSTS